MKSNKYIKKSDIVFAVFIAVAALCCFLFVFVFQPVGSVVVTMHGEKIAEFSLNENTTYTAKGDYTNIITIKDGYVYVEESDCPNEVCKKQGKISRAGESIICAPNGMIVSITGKGDVDAVTR